MNKTADFPRGVEVVTGGFVRRTDDGRFLLARNPKWQNQWTPPGGHVDPGETILAAATREVQEETGIVARPIRIVRVLEGINPPTYNRPAHFVYLHCLLETDRPDDVRLDPKEASELGWFSFDDLKTLDLSDSVRRTFAKIQLNGSAE